MLIKSVVFGFLIGVSGYILWQSSEGTMASLGLGAVVCGGGYFFLGLARMIFKR